MPQSADKNVPTLEGKTKQSYSQEAVQAVTIRNIQGCIFNTSLELRGWTQGSRKAPPFSDWIYLSLIVPDTHLIRECDWLFSLSIKGGIGGRDIYKSPSWEEVSS